LGRSKLGQWARCNYFMVIVRDPTTAPRGGDLLHSKDAIHITISCAMFWSESIFVRRRVFIILPPGPRTSGLIEECWFLKCEKAALDRIHSDAGIWFENVNITPVIIFRTCMRSVDVAAGGGYDLCVQATSLPISRLILPQKKFKTECAFEYLLRKWSSRCHR
jgi:hypothetical protein